MPHVSSYCTGTLAQLARGRHCAQSPPALSNPHGVFKVGKGGGQLRVGPTPVVGWQAAAEAELRLELHMLNRGLRWTEAQEARVEWYLDEHGHAVPGVLGRKRRPRMLKAGRRLLCLLKAGLLLHLLLVGRRLPLELEQRVGGRIGPRPLFLTRRGGPGGLAGDFLPRAE